MKIFGCAMGALFGLNLTLGCAAFGTAHAVPEDSLTGIVLINLIVLGMILIVAGAFGALVMLADR